MPPPQNGTLRLIMGYYVKFGQAGLSLIRQSLERLMTQGYIAEQPLEALARLWFGALVAGALYLVQAGDQPPAQADLTQSIVRVLTGLRIPP